MSQSLNIIKHKSDELPNNIEAEQSVIGSILLANEIFDEVSLIISNKNFYDPVHKKIFEALEKLIYGGLLATPLTLKNYFEKEQDELNIPESLVKIKDAPPRRFCSKRGLSARASLSRASSTSNVI